MVNDVDISGGGMGLILPHDPFAALEVEGSATDTALSPPADEWGTGQTSSPVRRRAYFPDDNKPAGNSSNPSP